MVTKITNEFKKDYFVRNLIDVDNSFAKYLADADFNYVIIYKGAVDVWVNVWGDYIPVIYGDESAVMNEIVDDNGNIQDGFEVMTEQDFLIYFCLDAIVDYINKKVLNINYFDGVNYILHFDNSFNGIIDINGMTDILNVSTDVVSKNISFLISNEDDTKQEFCYLSELMENVGFSADFLIKIIDYVEVNEKPTITPKGTPKPKGLFFITDLYDLLVRNTQYITEEEFFNKYIKNDETITLDTTENGEYYKIEFEKFNLVVVPK